MIQRPDEWHPDPATKFKTCSKCGESKDVRNFEKSKLHKGGTYPQCSLCRNKQPSKSKAYASGKTGAYFSKRYT